MALAVCTSAVFGLEVSKTTVEYQTHAMALETFTPRFGWQLSAVRNGTMQTAYELEVSAVDAGKREMMWQTGKVISGNSQRVVYGGKELEKGRKYVWRVRVWDENNQATVWSSANEFRMAPDLQQGDACWIGAIRAEDAGIPVGVRFPYTELRTPEYRATWNSVDSLSRRSIVLRKSFAAEKKIEEAMVYICGLGHYELSVNGNKVGDSEFAPLWSEYDKTLYYNSFDVSNLLRKGDNVMGVLLGNGFYNSQGGRYSKLRVSFGAPTLFVKMVIRYSDNTIQEIVTDGSWKYALSPVTFNDIYGGEDYDARLEEKGWNRPDFDDQHWKSVVVQTPPKGRLTAQLTPPVKIMKRFAPVSTKRLTAQEVDSTSKRTKRVADASAIVFDMGQNLSGFPEITVRGKKGDRITLVVGEAITPEGAPDQRQTGRQHLYHYTLKGDGDETWHPRFSYYGFRYIQVEGAVLKGDKNPRKLPLLKSIHSCFVHNSVSETSTFESSNVIFNRAHEIIVNAIKSNMHAVFTDCPHREKLGWLEQVHLNGPGLMFNFDLSNYMPKVMQDMVDAQQPNGMVPTTAPMYNVFGNKDGFDDFGDSPEWGSTIIIMPWMYFDFYGDSTLIVNYYHQMRRYVDYLTSRADKHIISFGLGDWYDYGDFKAGFSRNTPIPLVATAYYYYDLVLMAKAAQMVNNEYDVAYFNALAEQVKEAFNARFFNAETKQYGTGSQASNAIAIYLNLVEPQYRQAVIDNLLLDIRNRGNRLTTGDVGNRYLFQTLATNDLNEVMYLMHNHEETPGYGFQLKFGATTLTEQWDPRMGSSWNHFMMGQIDEWFFVSLAGIQPEASKGGMQHVVIRPQVVGDMTYVKASHETLYGKVAVDWKRENNILTVVATVPVNCTAAIYLPGEKEARYVKSGVHRFTVKL